MLANRVRQDIFTEPAVRGDTQDSKDGLPNRSTYVMTVKHTAKGRHRGKHNIPHLRIQVAISECGIRFAKQARAVCTDKRESNLGSHTMFKRCYRVKKKTDQTSVRTRRETCFSLGSFPKATAYFSTKFGSFSRIFMACGILYQSRVVS